MSKEVSIFWRGFLFCNVFGLLRLKIVGIYFANQVLGNEFGNGVTKKTNVTNPDRRTS